MQLVTCHNINNNNQDLDIRIIRNYGNSTTTTRTSRNNTDNNIIMKKGRESEGSQSGKRGNAKSNKNTNNNNEDDIKIDLSTKYLSKNLYSLNGRWILDKRLGTPSIKGFLEVMSAPPDIVDDYLRKDSKRDILCEINISESCLKIRSYQIEDIENTPRVKCFPFNEEIVERNGAKRTTVTSLNLRHVVIETNMISACGYVEYSDTKELVSKSVVSFPESYDDYEPELLMRQIVTMKNYESGKTHSLERYYLYVDP